MFEKRSESLLSQENEKEEDSEEVIEENQSNPTLLDAKNSNNKLFESMDSTIEDIRNTDITSGKKFDYLTKQGSNIEIPKRSKEAHNIYFYIADV
jgi:hypothetical protein